MSAVDQVTQRTASAAEELASTAEEMAAQAESLQQLVGVFIMDASRAELPSATAVPHAQRVQLQGVRTTKPSNTATGNGNGNGDGNGKGKTRVLAEADSHFSRF